MARKRKQDIKTKRKIKKKQEKVLAEFQLKKRSKYWNSNSFQPNNRAHARFHTSEERREAFARICEHFAMGLSKDCLTVCDWDTVKKYMAEFPEDCPEEELKIAMRIGQFVWENLGLQGAMGNIEGFNATSWLFNMKNRFGWKDQKQLEHSGAIASTTKEQRAQMTVEELSEAYQKAMQEI